MTMNVTAVAIETKEQSPVVERQGRYHALDALRIGAFLSVVVFHASESFEPGATSWAILDRSPSPLLSIIRYAFASFGLEIFFFVSGFFARKSFHKMGARTFYKERIAKLLPPLVVGWLVMYPLGVYLWLLGGSLSGNLSTLGIPQEYWSVPAWQLWVGFFAKGAFIPYFNLTHLWFLYQLLIVLALFVPLRSLFWRVVGRTDAHQTELDAVVARFCASPLCTLVFALLTMPVLHGMTHPWKNLVVDTPAYSLWPHPPTTVLYGGFFAFGWIVSRQPRILDVFGTSYQRNLVLAFATVLPAQYMGHLLEGVTSPYVLVPGARSIYFLVYAFMMWSFALGTIGTFVRFFREPGRNARFLSESSYWVYIAHWPLVIALQIAVFSLPIHWALKFAFINAVAIPLLFLSYRYLVRDTLLGRVLNGKPRP